MAFPGKIYREGNQLKIKGIQGVPTIFMVEQFGFNHYLNNDIFRVIDVLHDVGVNGFRVFGFWPFGRGEETEPYVKRGSIYDLNQFNESYFSYLHEWVSYAAEKGIIVLYELFDPCGLKERLGIAKYHPYYPITGANPLRLSKTSNTQFMQIQSRYVKKTIGTLPFPNVIWGIMNEFVGEKRWHYGMSKYVRRLAPNNLVSASDHMNPAYKDSHVDIWAVHTASYDFKNKHSNIGSDIRAMRRKVGHNKIVYYSTDGFMYARKGHENPHEMRRMAQDAVREKQQLLSFLDHEAYSNRGMQKGVFAQLNVKSYQAIAEVFQPTQLVDDPVQTELPEEYAVVDLPSSHPKVILDQSGKAIRDTDTQGYLCAGPGKRGYPDQLLRATFSIQIDNNSKNDDYVLLLDAYDRLQDQVLAIRVVTRKDFSKHNTFCKFELPFTPPSTGARVDFRIFYMGSASIIADTITVSEA
ncbi:hypothetical protein CSB45_07880 [candidate division KSB3 bacterium]|uniref:Glycoside hydrolase family 5 domain-containing protein n=1 Tax=candidate division KSB3 bacterium TaxID=2044937 RepID=A0A2G6E5R9_9BACT|nr:MAG: hypothetical protein CSB45_07880 [candidate division KSB3 bacterium]PIE29948.1 MAG: hypothetical protein CSA57_06580 [candidate division KSB3 bacterium]